MNKKYMLPGLCALGIFLADRLTKHLAITGIIVPWKMTSFLSFKLAFNTGITWGLLRTHDHTMHNILTIVIMCLIYGLTLYTYKRFKNNKSIIGELCVLAGAFSNLYDRFIYSGVIDFIQLSYNHWSWPIFNIADMAIVLGVVIMSIEVIKES